MCWFCGKRKICTAPNDGFQLNSTPQQNPSFSVSCAVPRSGRTLQNFLYKLVQLGADADEIERMQKVLSETKRLSTGNIEEVFSFLGKFPEDTPRCFSVFVDR